MAFRVSYRPNVIRITADGGALDLLLDAFSAAWGRSDSIYQAVEHAYRERAVWIHECDGDEAAMLADVFDRYSLVGGARLTWAAAKRYQADQLRHEAAELEAEALELDGKVAA